MSVSHGGGFSGHPWANQVVLAHTTARAAPASAWPDRSIALPSSRRALPSRAACPPPLDPAPFPHAAPPRGGVCSGTACHAATALPLPRAGGEGASSRSY